MKKFLVCGGAGFIGSRIVERLIELGHHVIALDDLSTGKLSNLEQVTNSNNFQFVHGDICDFDLCLKYTQNIDYCINQAALVSVPRSIDEPLVNNAININGFLNLLEACRLNKVKRVVYASSSAVYGDDLKLKKQEDIVGEVISPYALSKSVNEQYAKLYHKVYGLESVGLRYFNVYGPKQDPSSVYSGVISIFFDRLFSNQSLNIYGDGSVTRDFVFVDDVAEANILACLSDNDIAGKVYNIGTGKSNSINELATTLLKIFNNTQTINYLPERFGDIKYSCADILKAKRELKFEPKITLEVGLDIIYNHLNKKNLSQN